MQTGPPASPEATGRGLVKAKKKIVIFGLTVSSSWGNGHATLWRALLRSLTFRGHDAIFFERDVPYYASTRDLHQGVGYRLELYRDWSEALPLAEAALADADVAIVTSYCPDAKAASELVLSKPGLLHVFYDLDTAVTLDRLDRNERVEYVPDGGLSEFDLVLSFTGGRALQELESRLGARRTAPLYGSVDAGAHFPVDPRPHYRCDLSYLGTYSPDRQQAVERLFVAPARQLPEHRFVLGGSMYPSEFPWTGNIYFLDHVPPPDHPAFYCSSRLTLNVTRAAMASRGYCPSGRLFEAAACGTPILTDHWDGLETFFEKDREILIAKTTEDAVEAMRLPPQELARIGAAARERVMAEHTSDVRAQQMLDAFASC